MKVLMISKDRGILNNESAVFSRMKELSSIFDELHIVVVAPVNVEANVREEGNLKIYNNTSSLYFFSLIKALFTSFRITKRFYKKDHISSQDPFELGFLALIVSAIMKCRLQLQIHTDFLNPYFASESMLNAFRVFISKHILKYADCVRVVSEKIKHDVEAKHLTSAPIVVLPVFTDVEKIKNVEIDINLKEKFKSKYIVLSVGRLEREKNISSALRVFKLFAKSNPDSVLVIAGEGSLKATLQKEAEMLGIADQVHFLGFVKEPYALYKTSDVLLVTSNYEGFGLNMLEANILNLPIVSTNVGIAREVGAHIGASEEGLADELMKAKKGYKGEITLIPVMNREEYMKAYKGSFLC